MRDLLRQKLFEFENTFFSKVIRRALGMMIPFVLAAGIASAIRDLPIPAFQSLLQGSLQWLYLILNIIGGGFSAIFSLVLVITLSYCFAMEKNESFEYAMMYVIISLGAFVSQLDWQDGKLNTVGLGTEGCFCAIFVTYLVCIAYGALRKNKYITLQRYTAGVGGICAPAIQALLPMALIIFAVGIVNRIVCAWFHVEALYEVMDYLMQRLFEIASAHNSFLLGLIYIVAVQLLWFLGFHGSNVLNPVAQTVAFTDGASFFLKNFSDTFVSMGGSGTAICIWLALILFMRKKRSGKLAGVATIPILFNMNEILMFGKYKGKTYGDIYKIDYQYLHWLEKTDRLFKVNFEELKQLYPDVEKQEDISIADQVIDFGKYKGQKFRDIKDDISYLEWLVSIDKISIEDFELLSTI